MKTFLFAAALLGLASTCTAAIAPAGKRYVYKTVEGRDLHVWVRVPDNASAGTALPAVVFLHGGGWISGGPNSFGSQSEYLASRGMVAVQVEYRLLKKDGNEPPVVCIQDAKSAMRWVRKHAREFAIDPDRIAAAGGSAGGYLSAYLGLMDGIDDPADDLAISSKPNALILFNPVIDNGPGGWGYNRTGEDYMKYSPFHNVHTGVPPTIILAAENDKLIPVKTLLAFRDKVRDTGARCEVIVYPGQEHGFFNSGRSYNETLIAADGFLTSLGWLHGTATITPDSIPPRPAPRAKK